MREQVTGTNRQGPPASALVSGIRLDLTYRATRLTRNFPQRLNGPGLTNYGDAEFSLFLRKAFIKGAGYSDDALDRKIVGVIDTGVRLAFPVCWGSK